MKVLQINEAQQVAGGEFNIASHDCLEYAKKIKVILNNNVPNAADDYYKAFEIAAEKQPDLRTAAPCTDAELKTAFAGLAVREFLNNKLGV